jgi:ORF6N domain
MTAVVATERIERLILLIRGHKVILDADLADLYGVETRALTQAVKRNLNRFPADFMFQLSDEEAKLLRSHIVTSKNRRGGRRYLPYAFTEQGVAMLSGVLNSERAVEVNIEIMRAFVRLREMLLNHKDLAHKLDALERKFESHDVHIRSLFEAIRQLMTPPEPNKRKIGFLVKERAARYRRG